MAAALHCCFRPRALTHPPVEAYQHATSSVGVRTTRFGVCEELGPGTTDEAVGTEEVTRDNRRKGRVVESHRIVSSAFRLGGVFGLISLGWSLLIITRGGSWWGPLHAFLAGTVLLAVSGATQLFTITWAAAPAPRAVVATGQRWAVAIGVGLALVGVAIGNNWITATGAVFVVVGLATLAGALVGAVRRSLLRRFDLSSRFYLVALAAGAVGVTLGGVLGAGVAESWYLRMRLVHSHLNLVGLVGLTIVGTLPTILPTFAHHKSVSGREALVAWWIAAGSVAAIASGLVLGAEAVGVGTIMAGAALAVVVAGVLGRLGRRGLKGRLPYYQVTIGCGWLAAWTVVDGGRLLLGSTPEPFAAWTTAVIVGGVGQVLLGSFAYLVPVLVGPPPRLGRNLERTQGRPWLPLVLANLAGIGFVSGLTSVAGVATGLWALDFAYRLVRIEWRDHEAARSSHGLDLG